MDSSFTSDVSGRLDILIAQKLEISRNQAQNIIKVGVTVDGKVANKSGFLVAVGDKIEYNAAVKTENKIIPSDIAYKTVYEDDDIIVIDKPRGLVVHPAPGHHSDTLANALAFKYDLDEEMADDENRMGIVHRIDKDTSGLLVVAKNENARKFLADQIADHNVGREYVCLAYGHPREERFKVDGPIGRNRTDRKKMAIDLEHGKPAVTHFHLIRQYAKTCLLTCTLETGRTHQIRVHLSFIGFPIVGDKSYSIRESVVADQGQVLHAYKLTLIHPTTKKIMTFYAPIDDYFKKNLIYWTQN